MTLSPHFRPHEQLAAARFAVRWLLILTPVAIAIGSAVALFLWSLDEVTEARFDHPWLISLLPVFGLISAWLYLRFGQSAEGGNSLLFAETHEPRAGVPVRMAPLIFVTTVGAHLFGASVGREGTSVQMGGGIAAGFNRVFRLSGQDLRILLMASIAAGFGAVFGTPLAGAVFALEVLAIGYFETRALFPALYAALASDFVVGAWEVGHTHYAIAPVAASGHLPFDGVLMAKAAVAGVAFGLAAALFAELTQGIARLFRRLFASPLARPVAGGLVTIALAGALGTTAYLGLGVSSPDASHTTIVSSFTPDGADPLAWWWKLLFTAVAIGAGFKGGEVTPLFFIGAALGNRAADLLDAPVDLFAGLGFVAVFAAAANTPLACIVMGIELFGADAAPYLAVACITAYLASGRSTIYRSQTPTMAGKAGSP